MIEALEEGIEPLVVLRSGVLALLKPSQRLFLRSSHDGHRPVPVRPSAAASGSQGCREPDDGCLCRSYAYAGRNPRYQPILGDQCGLMGTVVATVHRI